MKTVLASASKYRKEQLQSIGLKFDVQPSLLDEEPIKNKYKDVQKITEELAKAKALDVLEKFPNSLVIGGDQMLEFESKAIGKAGTKENAIEQLLAMSAKQARLITSICVASSKKTEVITVIANMKFKKLSEDQISKYVDFANPIDCSGSFKLEKGGVALFDTIECEDHTSIIGIPLMKLSQILMENATEIWES